MGTYPISAAAAVAMLFFGSAAGAQEQEEMPPAPVGVLELELHTVPRVFELPGRARAYEEAVIRPRVDGIVTGVLYSPGAEIKAGDPMFSIGSETYDASVAEAEAAAASATATVEQAEAAHARAQRLLGSGTTQTDLENALSTLQQARASLKAAQAKLNIARTQLSWTTVTSPIDGMASVPEVSVGALVSASQTDALAHVTRLDPIDVDMYEPFGSISRIRDEIGSGDLRVNEGFQARLTLDNDIVYQGSGEFIAPDYKVSSTTGTVEVRFRFENPDFTILPGMFVRGQVKLGETDALLVPQLAAQRGRDGKLTAWVAQDGVAQQRVLTEDGVFEHSWIISDGLSAGDLLIVNGLSAITQGAPVAPVPVQIDASGVIGAKVD